MGAFVLASAASYFPQGAIHVAVVDPGVGTKRRPILVETSHAFYIGPDNGLLMLAAQRSKIRHTYHIVDKRYMLPRVSRTFHGRDIFAPTAAHLAKGCKPSDFGPEIHDYIIPKFAKPSWRKDELSGEVLHVDDFGNIITNISQKDLKKAGITEGSKLSIKLNGKTIKTKFCSTYGEVPVKALLALIGSHDFLEIAVYQGDASEKFKAKAGSCVTILLE
jgi:S-adenosylmethionine hydrolase